MGGLVALDLALARPDLVASLVLVGAPVPGHAWSEEMKRFDEAEETALGRGDVDEAVELNLRMWVDGPHRAPDQVDVEVRRSVGEMQRRAFELQLAVGDQATGELLVSNLGDRLREVSVAALILVGELDCDDMLATAARLAAGIPGARSGSIAATAHVPSMERPAEFDRLVLDFLAG